MPRLPQHAGARLCMHRLPVSVRLAAIRMAPPQRSNSRAGRDVETVRPLDRNLTFVGRKREERQMIDDGFAGAFMAAFALVALIMLTVALGAIL